MKSLLWLTVCALLLGVPAAQAQQVLAASSAPPPGSALPPPGINDPGAKPQKPRNNQTTQSVPLPSTGIRESVAPAARQQGTSGQQGGNGQASSGAAISKDANAEASETDAEYRRSHSNGNTNGSQVRDPKLGPVSPVYYTVYKWGKPARPAAASSAAPAQAPPPSSGQ